VDHDDGFTISLINKMLAEALMLEVMALERV